MERWTELRTAYQVAKLGTVSAASRALGTHRATVSRHIDALEAELGAPIFIRGAKGYTLTELGEAVLEVARKTDELFEDLLGRAKGRSGSLEGEIKITSLHPLTGLLMQPVAAFRKVNPSCQVTIIATEDLQRLEYGEAHVALRAGPKPDHPDYVVQPFGTVALNLYALDSYLGPQEGSIAPDDLRNFGFVMPTTQENHLPILSWIMENVPEPKVAIAASDPIILKEAVCSGLGLGVLSELDFAGRSDLRALLPDNSDWHVPLWLVTHVDLHRTEKVQAMLAHLKDART